jgi:hypothetical protein
VYTCINVYSKTASEGYNYGFSAAINVMPNGSSTYPSVNLISGGSSSYSTILWQDGGYDALTGSAIGAQAAIYSYNDGNKAHFFIYANNNLKIFFF